MGVGGRAEAEGRVAAQEIEQPIAATGETGDRDAAIDRLARIGENPGRHQIGDPVGDEARVETEVAMVPQGRQDRLGQGPEADLERRPVLDPLGDETRDRRLDRAAGRETRGRARRAGAHDHVDVVAAEIAFPAQARQRLVDLDDHDAGRLDQRHQIFVGRAEAEAPGLVFRRDPQHQHVDPLGEMAGEARIGQGQDVEDTGAIQPPIGAGAAIGDEADPVGVLRGDRPRPGHADEGGEVADVGAAGHQGRDEAGRLGRGLAPGDDVAGADERREVERIECRVDCHRVSPPGRGDPSTPASHGASNTAAMP